MARKTQIVTIEAEGRDKDKRFLLTEMSASQAEWWATRVVMAAVSAGVSVPEGTAANGMAGFAGMSLDVFAKIPPDQAKPLLDEMFSCIQFLPNPKDPTVARHLYDDDIEEIATRIKLRFDVIKLHIGFFSQEGV